LTGTEAEKLKKRARNQGRKKQAKKNLREKTSRRKKNFRNTKRTQVEKGPTVIPNNHR